MLKPEMAKEINPLILTITDYLASMAVGVASTLLPALIVPHGWSMAASMFAGMVVAMTAAFFIVNAIAPYTGPFEIAMPAMIIAMFAGMVPLHAASLWQIVLAGLAAGALVQGAFHVYDMSLRGEVKR